MSDQGEYVVRIERTFHASAETVFDAWTHPEVMRRWFHCAFDWVTPEVEVDLREGGRIRVRMRMPEGREVEAQGRFIVIDRPHRLTMSWVFDDVPSNEQMLELTFAESAGATTVVLVNSRISNQERRDEQGTGWQGCLDQLEREVVS